MFTLKYRYLVIILLAVYSYFNTLFSEVYTYYNIHAPVYVILFVILLLTIFIWEGDRFIQNFLLHFFQSNTSSKFFVSFFIAGIVLSAVSCIIVLSAINIIFLHYPLTKLQMPFRLAFTYATRINLFLQSANLIFIFVKKYRSKELEAEELKRISAQAQLQAIKNQVNPHFLFNNLNVLSSLVMLDNPDANKFIEEFAKVYRHILSSQQEELITLRTELDYMEPYIFLLKKRFPESILIDIKIAENFYTWHILPAALQMLIENAIKHNITSRVKPLHIKIFTNHENKLTVTNNLQLKIPDGPSTNIGLKNIEQRYDLIAGKKINIIKTEHSFSVVLPLIQEKYENDYN